MSEEEKEDKGFRVSDRRRFSVSEKGEARDEGMATGEAKTAAGEAKRPEANKGRPPGQAEATGRQERAKEPGAGPLPEIDFATFIVSLSSSVLIHLGVVADPMTGQKQMDLPIAKQTIDMLGMLQEKTRGNLTNEESQLLESMLYDLRMRYVAESK
jgi:hypothetical protein